MQKIKANEFEITVEMVSPVREPRGLHIVLEDNRPLAEIAKDFSGRARLELTSELSDGVTIYDGYTELTSVYRRGGVVSLVLEKGA